MQESVLVGLRVDVDTFRGTRDGVPKLLQLLKNHGVTASFFFSVGPDNMGRHLWRLFRPVFLRKMLRSHAVSLYGWDILLRGTFWPGPCIGKQLASVIHATSTAGHEVGLHAWDHYRWQRYVETMSRHDIHEEIRKGVDLLTEILGIRPVSSAAAGWKCTRETLLEKENFGFRYNSDCRGERLFRPLIDELNCGVPQIPVTLPTYDEVIGRSGITPEKYNDYLLSLINPNQLNVLAIHAEAEGIACAGMFDSFLEKSISRGIQFVPLWRLLPGQPDLLPVSTITQGSIPGREGLVCMQGEDVSA